MCYAIEQGATEDALMVEIRRELEKGNAYATIASAIPESAWRNSLALRVADEVVSGSWLEKSRIELFRVLWPMSPEKALPIARKWVALETNPVNDPRRLAGLDALLVLNPDEAIPFFEVEAKRGIDGVLKLQSLLDMSRSRRIPLDSLSIETLGRLTRSVLELLPAKNSQDEVVGAHVVSPTEELWDLRWRFVNELHLRSATSRPLLESLQHLEPSIKARLGHDLALKEMQMVVNSSLQPMLWGRTQVFSLWISFWLGSILNPIDLSDPQPNSRWLWKRS